MVPVSVRAALAALAVPAFVLGCATAPADPALDAKVESVAVKEGQQVSNRAILVTMAADAAPH